MYKLEKPFAKFQTLIVYTILYIQTIVVLIFFWYVFENFVGGWNKTSKKTSKTLKLDLTRK